MQQSSLHAESLSILTPYGYQNGSCGYCKDPNTSQRTPMSRGAYYAGTKRLTVDHYQALVDRGCRRSGLSLYKPDQIRSCCPHYTIRLPVSEMKLSRDQRQTINRWNRFVVGDEYIKTLEKLHPKSREEKRRTNNGFDLVSAVHESEYGTLKVPPISQHRFEVTLESTDFSEEKYLLYEQYQRLVHKDPPRQISRAGFKRFLCSSPLVDSSLMVDGQERVFGSRHQCYRLDGNLIALGVIDLLPRAVSAVYFIYHVSFEKHGFGKLSALREAALALEGGYMYYNMGYYIHSCPKMRYKRLYDPQYILDPDTYEWYKLDWVVLLELEKKKFVSLSREPSAALQALQIKPEGESKHVPLSAAAEKYTTPTEAVQSGDSLLTFRMPGMMATQDVEAGFAHQPPLIAIGTGAKQILFANDLRGWDDASLDDASSVKGAVGELVAVVGAQVASKMIVDFSGA